MIARALHKWYHKYIKRDKLYSYYSFVNQSQYNSTESNSAAQQQMLGRLLKHANNNVPYYTHLFKKYNVDVNQEPFKIIANIPFLTKNIIRSNTDNLKATNLPENRFIKNSTSGSTGSNLLFYSDTDVYMKQALDMRCKKWMGLDIGQREYVIWGASWDNKKLNKLLPRLKSRFKSIKMVSGYQLSDDDFYRYYHEIKSIRPKLLTSYPSILYEFALFLKKNRLTLKLPAIKSAGEKLYPYQRELIEQFFQSQVYDFYGGRDIPMVAMQCGNDTGLHIMSENVYLEVIDDNGNTITEGEGELVLTDLHNYAFPFIRYKIGDRARISNKKCTCGRNLPMLEEVIGRTFDIIQFPNGNRVGGSFWTLVMRSFPGIKDFQVEQLNQNKILIRYIPDTNTYLPGTKEAIRNNIKKYSNPGLIIEFEKVNIIPKNKAGKQQFVISKHHSELCK